MKVCPPQSGIRSILVALAACLSLGLAVTAAWANDGQKIKAAGDPLNLWIIKPTPDGKGFITLHRRVKDEPQGRLNPVPPLRGTLIPGGAVAGDGLLWLFYTDGSVQTLRVLEDAMGRRRFSDGMLPTLPRGIKVRSIAVTSSGAWVLARIEDQRLLDAIDNPQGHATTVREKRKARLTNTQVPQPDANTKSETQPPVETPQETPQETPGDSDKDKAKEKPATDGPESKADQPTAKDAAELVVRPAAATVKADRLLHLGSAQWESIPLPADWNVESPAWLVAPSYADARPLLVTTTPAQKLIRWYTWGKAPAAPDAPATSTPAAEQWNVASQSLELAASALPTVINNQLVVAQRLSTTGRIEFAVTQIRPERVTDLGVLGMAAASDSPWALTPVGDQLGLITFDAQGEIQMVRMNLRGTLDENPMTLAPEPPSIGQIADLLVFVFVLALVTPVLILMWKREPTAQPVELPKGLRIGDLPTRFTAAMIDLLPCIYVTSWLMDVSMEKMLNFWPGRSGGWEPMIPGAVAIGMYVGHTFLFELFTGRSLGKAMVGQRVTNMEGGPPDVWQVLARNLFKILDLIATPLLIFAIISPNRQRLGDVVGRTIVVAAMPADPNAKKPDEKDDDEDRNDPPDHRPKRRR